MKIALVTVYDKNYEEIAAITRPVMEEYCQRHRYEFTPYHKGASFKYYEKIKIFKSLFEYTDTQIIFYLDIDCLISNITQKIEYYLDDTNLLYVCRDFTEINFGSCIIVKSEWTRWFIDEVLSLENQLQNEQNCINLLYKGVNSNNYIKLLNHPSINSYDYSLYAECSHIRGREEGHWHEGDFILHVPALDLKRRAEVLSNAKDKIVR